MKICGLKLTHDATVALVENNTLLFSCELEKIKNNYRYSELINTDYIENIINFFGYKLSDIDLFVVDGWGGYNRDHLAKQPRLDMLDSYNTIDCVSADSEYKLKINKYTENKIEDNILKTKSFNGLKIGKREYSYDSFLHVSGHLLSAYNTSDFSKSKENSYILIWDGGMYPRLYFLDHKKNKIFNLGPIFLLVGNIYSIFSQHFNPFKADHGFAKDDLSIAGKIMAYIAKGKIKEELFKHFDDIYNNYYDRPMGFANLFAKEFKKRSLNYKDEDVLTSFHAYLENLLINKLKKKISRFDFKCRNLCIAGGCGLNIKWNSAIKNDGFFNKVYVPPFPNDSGSAIGMACCGLFKYNKKFNYLDWDVYSGNDIIKNKKIDGWAEKKLSIKKLAKIMHEENEPVMILNKRAELGPRSLGNRSIFAPAHNEDMKIKLNSIKKRESYRPISPICLEEEAKKIFLPGNKEPFMLFDHIVKKKWCKKIPAVVHLDGTARLQTINKKQNKVIYEFLYYYNKLSSIPLLCNTSANFHGRGFFPDIKSALKWGKVKYVWSDGFLYFKIK
jgi:carbamoyltransferase